MKKKLLRVGVTGGIGSGKSTVCQIFNSLKIPIYYADIWAKWILSTDEAVIEKVKKIFGEEAYLPDGQYNRPLVAKIAFAAPEKLAALNEIVHPAIENHSRQWHEHWQQANKPYTIKEAALMIESGSHKFLDKLIVVTAPEDLRIQRVCQRDGLTENEVRARIKNQLPEEEKVKLADFTIKNDGQHALIPQVWQIHQSLLQEFRGKNYLENRA